MKHAEPLCSSIREMTRKSPKKAFMECKSKECKFRDSSRSNSRGNSRDSPRYNSRGNSRYNSRDSSSDSSPDSPRYNSPDSLGVSHAGFGQDQLARLEKAKAFCKIRHLRNLAERGKASKASIPQCNSWSYAIMSRIYVGSINFELNEEHIRSSFSQFGHIKDISMTLDPATGRHKGYCFVEFLAPDAAQLALDSMNGWYLGGRQIKVGRPNNYNPAILPAPTLIPTRIYVSNINKNITEDNIRSIFESFGELKECLLLPEVSEYSKCAYIEFQDENKVQATVNSMNNLELEGQPLRVCKAFYGGPLSREMCSNSPASRWSKSHEVKDSATEDGSLDEDLSIGVNQRYTIMQKLFRNLNTRSQNALQNVPQKIGILQQEACPDARALILDQIALVRNIDADFETEISMECEKFGEINGMFICINEREDRISHSKCTDYANVDLDSRISVYVLFDSHKSCLNAQAALDKRFFAGRIVNAVLCKTQDYNNSSKYAFNIKKFSENQTNLDKSFNMCT